MAASIKMLFAFLFVFCVTAHSFAVIAVPDTGEKKMDSVHRETQILGHPPRIEPLSPSNYPDDIKNLVAEVREAVGAPPVEIIPEYFATMAKHPQLMRQQIDLSMTFFKGYLSTRDRQLAILRTLWLNQAPYAWSQHVDVSKREAGFSTEEIDSITKGAAAGNWNDQDRAILLAVEELHDDAMISAQTWSVLASRLSEQELLELPLLVGTYQATAYLQNSVGFRLMGGFKGLQAR